ncbi:MAG: S-adenosylmethionine decarboxylase [Chloroflexota bacterium]|nr:S-adenosylmethionine decarboxylase [Chloroflexota bacterium]
MHLIIDGFGSNPNALEDEDSIYEFLDQYPAEIGMTKIASPKVYRYVGSKPEDWGLSGIVLIAESHISMHTFVEHSFVNVDIFSCKDFDVDQAVECLRERLCLSTLKTWVLSRGWDSFNQDRIIEAREMVMPGTTK